MKLPITTANKINNPMKGFGYAFIDAEDNKLKIKKYDSVIEFSNDLSDVQLLDLIDYTAFEVWPNSKTYLPGETISNTNTYMDGNVVGYGKRLEGGKVTVEGIPSGNMHRMRFQSAIEPSKCDVIIDWGDGTIQSLKDHTIVDARPTEQSEADMSCVHYYYEESGTHEYDYQVCHKYLELDKIYTVKIYGKDYWSICHNEIKGESNIISRVFTNDLPIASHLTCFNQFLNGQIRLFNLDIPAHHSKQFHSLNATFGWCLNLRKVTGLAGLNTLHRFSNLFNNCKELIYTDFQIPGYISYKSPFGALFAHCEKLSMDILNIFPVNNFVAGTKINISNAFYNCKLISCSDFEKLGQMLWNNENNIFVTSNPFAACSNEFRSHVPQSWGGTASNDIIEKSSHEKITDLEDDINLLNNSLNSSISELNEKLKNVSTSGIIPLNTLEVSKGNNNVCIVTLSNDYNCYKLTPTTTVNLKFDNSNVKEFDGGEFYLMLDFTNGIKTVNFPDTFTWKQGTTAPTINAQKLYIFKCTYLYTDPIAYVGEFIAAVTNQDYDKGIWLFEGNTKDTSLVISGYNGISYLPEFNFNLNENTGYYLMCINEGGKIESIGAECEYQYGVALGCLDIEINGGYVGSICKETNECVSCPGALSCTINDGYLGSFSGTWQDSIGIGKNAKVGTIYECNVGMSGGEVDHLYMGTYDCASQTVYGGKINTISWYGMNGGQRFDVSNAEINEFKMDNAWDIGITFSNCKINTINTYNPSNAGCYLFNLGDTIVEKIILSRIGDPNWSHYDCACTFDISSGSTINLIEIDTTNTPNEWYNFIINIKSGAVVNIATNAHPNTAKYITYNIEAGATVNYIN